MPGQLAVVIPALNEKQALPRLLSDLAALRRVLPGGLEVVVVDGGSRDGTAGLAAEQADQVISSPPGRGRQMNAGASVTTADWLWFLHADTRLTGMDGLAVTRTLTAGRAWGRFDVRIAGEHWMLSVIAVAMNLRSRLTGIATGDQGLFVAREAFEAVGGFPEQPLMEDIALSGRLKAAVGRPACLRGPLVTAGRRWEANGVWRTVTLMWRLRWRYWRGGDPVALARDYRRGTP